MSHSGNDPSRQTRWVWYNFLWIGDEKHPFTWKSSNVAPSQGGDAEEGGDQIQREGLQTNCPLSINFLLQMTEPNVTSNVKQVGKREDSDITGCASPRWSWWSWSWSWSASPRWSWSWFWSIILDDLDLDLDQPHQGDHVDAVCATPKSKIMPNYLRIPTNQAPLGSQP